MRAAASQPTLSGPELSGNTETLLLRRRTTTNKLFTDFQQSPLHDLNAIAQPGLTNRVTRNNTVGTSLDLINEPWSRGNAEVLTVEGGYTPGLVAAAATSLVGSFLYGFHLGNMNSAAGAMRIDLGVPGGDDAQGVANDTAWGFAVSIFCLGAMVGCSVVAPIADSIGRRRTILLKLFIFLLGTALEVASVMPGCSSPPCTEAGLGFMLMLAGRFVVGMASGATTVVVPMYLGEISPPHLRGALGTYFQLTSCAGILLAQILGLPAVFGHGHWWAVYLMLPLLPILGQLVMQARLVESPRWLASRTESEALQAQKVLAQLRGEEEDSLSVVQELDMMQMNSNNATGSRGGGGIGAMLVQPKTRKALIICVVCSFSQQVRAWRPGTRNRCRAPVPGECFARLCVRVFLHGMAADALPAHAHEEGSAPSPIQAPGRPILCPPRAAPIDPIPTTPRPPALQCSGINNIFNFSTIFLTANGLAPATVSLIAVLMNIGNVGITVLSVDLMDRAGRRFLLLLSIACMAATLFLLTLALSVPGQVWTSPLAVASVVGFVMSFGIGVGPVPWLLPAEFFSAENCAKGTAASAGTNWLANFLVGQAFLPLANVLKSVVFLPFAVVLCLFFVFVKRNVPETRAKSLAQILKELE
jgi:MFS family permease